MKFQMNFTTDADDVRRYTSAEDLRTFYRRYGCSGLELMPLPYYENGTWTDASRCPLIGPDMVTGVHLCCTGDWMDLERGPLMDSYRKDLEYARSINAEYVVFHVTQISDEEAYTYRMKHEDVEVIDASCTLINELLDGQGYTFWFLMENLWWPGLNFLSPDVTGRLLDGVHYPKKGFMLDTGHFLHTNLDLETQEQSLAYLQTLLDSHRDYLPYIKGLHLQQSLTGAYVREWLAGSHTLPSNPAERFCKIFEHIFALDLHQPFTIPGIRDFVEHVDPLYVTYEYITKNRREHAEYLSQGARMFLR